MGMDRELAAMYGTPTGTQEDVTKVAEAELFAKLAADNNIDLNQLNDEQVAHLWNATFPKEASAEAPDEEAEKIAAAAAEFQAQKEWQEKVAECDKLGRVMAHAYVQELGLISKQAEFPPGFGGGKKDEGEKDEEKGEKDDDAEEEKKEEKKEASALDQLAVKHAVGLAKQAGFDPSEAARRLDAVLTLSLVGPSEKTAAARNLNESIEIRALEYLQGAGYPVKWAQ